MLAELKKHIHRPELFEPGTSKFWDDEHISKSMLQAHLDPLGDPATRNHAFVDRSADWIARTLPPQRYPRLLDLGCGPGLYARRFHERGYRVTGVDLSKRSIDYAIDNARHSGYPIEYLHQSYLDLSLPEAFDCAVLIYCDYGVLSEAHRKKLLGNVRRALKPGGRLLLDVCTPLQYKGREESTGWSYCESGFWKADPHLCLESFFRYDDSHTFLNQYLVITEAGMDRYNIWDQTFEVEGLKSELGACGFSGAEIYGDVAGADYFPESRVICAIARKEN